MSEVEHSGRLLPFILEPLVDATRGGILRLEVGFPSVRAVRVASRRNWIGTTPRNAYEVRDVRLTQLLPG